MPKMNKFVVWFLIVVLICMVFIGMAMLALAPFIILVLTIFTL